MCDGRLQYTQAKNEHRKPAHMDIPVHPELARIIAATPSGHLTFLVNENDRPFTVRHFGRMFRKWCDEAVLPHCSAHGLRYATAAYGRKWSKRPRDMAITGPGRWRKSSGTLVRREAALATPQWQGSKSEQ
jgi:hypothetical protein